MAEHPPDGRTAPANLDTPAELGRLVKAAEPTPQRLVRS